MDCRSFVFTALASTALVLGGGGSGMSCGVAPEVAAAYGLSAGGGKGGCGGVATPGGAKGGCGGVATPGGGKGGCAGLATPAGARGNSGS